MYFKNTNSFLNKHPPQKKKKTKLKTWYALESSRFAGIVARGDGNMRAAAHRYRMGIQAVCDTLLCFSEKVTKNC